MKNQFLSAVGNVPTTQTENGALAYASTGSELINQFTVAGTFRGRHIQEVFRDQNNLEASNPEYAMRLVGYLRLITRTSEGETVAATVQRGQGNRDEAFKRFLWYAQNQPERFYANLPDFCISIGRIRDVYELLEMARNFKITVDENKAIATVLQSAIAWGKSEMVKKYMPEYKSSKKCTTPKAQFRLRMARLTSEVLNLDNSREYRKLKASGTAHQWQQLISRGEFSEINFNRIPGKALLKLVNSKFLNNQKLTDKYEAWVLSKPTVPFNGYVYELAQKVTYNMSNVLKVTLDKQFEMLLETGKKDTGGVSENVWVAIDTSGSMNSQVLPNVTANLIGVSLGIYFANMNTGAFNKKAVRFDDTSTLINFTGNFTDQVLQAPHGAMGGTNFQSVIDLLIQTRKMNPAIPLEDYPTTILAVSDMQFNPTGNGHYMYGNDRMPSQSEVDTNYQAAIKKLASVFPTEYLDKVKFVWWYVTGRNTDTFPSNMNDGGTYMFGGFDGAVLNLLLGDKEQTVVDGVVVKPSMEDQVKKSLSQEVLTWLN